VSRQSTLSTGCWITASCVQAQGWKDCITERCPGFGVADEDGLPEAAVAAGLDADAGGAEDFLEGPDAFNAESDAHHAVA
jgi:hypothetical protein